MQSIEHPPQIQPPSAASTGVSQGEMMRPRSNTSGSAHTQRPKSRGSTTSLQSVGIGAGYQPNPEQLTTDPHGMFAAGPGPQGTYQETPEEMLLRQYQMTHHQMDPHAVQHDMRPQSQHGYPEMQGYPVSYPPSGLPQYPMHTAGTPQAHLHHHMRHHSEHYMAEGSPAPDDSNTENGGAKRRKGTASSVANDQELRRLLEQHEGKSLKEVASEVQRNEGGGGKSEKAKQVFAMIWLRENCKRSNSSVRRDKVFARYTERCGNERVPTLNPASFGKLVRIIFPNVQTRRLGVRGESKYHYVDLSLIPDDSDQSQPGFAQPTSEEIPSRQNSTDTANKSYFFPSHMRTVSLPQNSIRQSTETADFPDPSSTFLSRPSQEVPQPALKEHQAAPVSMDCQYLNTPTIRIPSRGMASSLVAALPSIRPNLPATLSTYLSMPSTTSRTLTPPNSQDSPIELPDIHSYLTGVNYDYSIASSLSHLYRSYCIDVIDAFRKCKEKPFFNHHSAFNGKMTVPVAKLFSLQKLAPWIQECDMRMYKQMVRFLAPLALQNVPDAVWAVFDRVSARLVTHLVAAFDEKCPAHVVIAKIVPAARFANLLKKLKNVNAGAVQMAKILEDDTARTQMWLDLVAIVDPERVIDDSLPPPDALETVEGMLRSDLKILLTPMSDPLVAATEEDPNGVYANFMVERHASMGVMSVSATEDQVSGPLDRCILWLERLPQAFDTHHPQCMINWHTGFWKSIITQLGLGGAPSYQAWYFLEPFMTSMLRWMTQMEGMLLEEGAQKELENREEVKRSQQERRNVKGSGDSKGNLKRKRTDEDVGGDERSRSTSHATDKSGPLSQGGEEPGDGVANAERDVVLDETAETQEAENDDDDDMDEIRRSGPLDLPSINTSSSPLKRLRGHQHLHDDSGIDLGLDIEDGNGSAGDEHLKNLKKESWILSDPVDAEGHVTVI